MKQITGNGVIIEYYASTLQVLAAPDDEEFQDEMEIEFIETMASDIFGSVEQEAKIGREHVTLLMEKVATVKDQAGNNVALYLTQVIRPKGTDDA